MPPHVAYTVVFLWLSGGLASPAAPAAPGRLEDLQDFAAARGLAVQFAAAPSVAGLPSRDDALADRLENELEQARTALSALEEAAAAQRLLGVEADLRAHPHLPQAAFLMAECLALQAQAAREADPARAATLESRRLALEGPRAPAFGETPSPAGEAPGALGVKLTGLQPGDALEVDGVEVGAVSTLSLVPGLHHLRVWRGGRPVFATFATVQAGQVELALDAPLLAPCSTDDLSAARTNGAGAPLPGIACGSWGRARQEGTGIGVSLCQRSQCGPFVHWQRQAPAPFAPIPSERHTLPAWASFTIVGAAALLTTGLVLWQSGALDRGQRAETTLEYGGLNPQALRF